MRILNIEIPSNKKIFVSLMSIYGIGLSRSIYICKICNINFLKKTSKLNESELYRIGNELNNYIIEGNLKRLINLNIKNLIDLKCYRGIRHLKKLPVRGQRTRSNAKTRKRLKNFILKKKKIIKYYEKQKK